MGDLVSVEVGVGTTGLSAMRSTIIGGDGSRVMNLCGSGEEALRAPRQGGSRRTAFRMCRMPSKKPRCGPVFPLCAILSGTRRPENAQEPQIRTSDRPAGARSSKRAYPGCEDG